MKCQRCNGSVIHDGHELVCLLCGRPVVVVEPLPLVHGSEGSRRYEPRHAGAKV